MIGNFKNILSNALYEEANDLIKKMSTLETSDKKSFVDTEGYIVLPTNKDLSESYLFTDIDIASNDDDDEEYIGGSSFLELCNAVDKNAIVKLDADYDFFKDMLVEMFNNEDKSIYGIILSFEGKRINPLHPVTALMISTKEIVLPDTFTMIIYPYDGYTPHYNEYYTERITNMMSEISNSMYKSTGNVSFTKNININMFSEQDNFRDINFEFDEKDGNSRPQYVLSPIQIMTYEIAYPYYGFVASYTDGGEYKSRNLAPMLSGNINVYANDIHEWCNTCTGSESNMNIEGLAVLNDMNTGSLYFDNTLHGGWIDWAYNCQIYSIYHMFKDDLENTEPVEKTILSTVKEVAQDMSIEDILAIEAKQLQGELNV